MPTDTTADNLLARAFLEQSRRLLVDEYWPRLRGCVETLTDDQVWWRPNDASNSIGNLLLHLHGNVRQWIVVQFTGADDRRDRPAEFTQRTPLPRGPLLTQLGATVEQAGHVLQGLSEADLHRPLTVQGYTCSGLAAVYHVVEHFAMHYGQIVFVTKQLRGEDLGFYRELDATGRREQ